MATLIGNTVRWRCEFRLGTVLTDPTTVVCKVRSPRNARTTYSYSATVIKEATGVYYVQMLVSEAGPWLVRWESTFTGGISAAAESIETISPSQY